MPWPLTLQRCGDCLGGSDGHAAHGGCRLVGQVRSEHDVVEPEERVVGEWWFLFEDIQPRAGDPSGPEATVEGFFVNDSAARRVDDNGTGRQEVKLSTPEETVCRWRERHMHGYHCRTGQ